jgi:hypothetical protein
LGSDHRRNRFRRREKYLVHEMNMANETEVENEAVQRVGIKVNGIVN